MELSSVEIRSYVFLYNYMNITNRLKITISPIRLPSSSSLQILRSIARLNSFLPSVNILPLKLHSISSINLYGASNYNIFRYHIRLLQLYLLCS